MPRRAGVDGHPQPIGLRRTPSPWDQELDALRPILTVASKHLGEGKRWYRLYLTHFGEIRSLSEAEFRDLFFTVLSRKTTRDLLDGDMKRYAIDTIRAGEALCRRGVPFAEVVASLHLAEDSVTWFITGNSPALMGVWTTWEKLLRAQVLLMHYAYSRSTPDGIQKPVRRFRRGNSRQLC